MVKLLTKDQVLRTYTHIHIAAAHLRRISHIHSSLLQLDCFVSCMSLSALESELLNLRFLWPIICVIK